MQEPDEGAAGTEPRKASRKKKSKTKAPVEAESAIRIEAKKIRQTRPRHASRSALGRLHTSNRSSTDRS